MAANYFSRKKNIIIYSIALALLLLFLKWIEYRLLIIGHASRLYLGVLAILFTGLGIWLAIRLAKPNTRTVVVEKQIMIASKPASPFVLNTAEIAKLNISKRELEVLQLMGEGLGNREIAGRLFVSLNTVKTHSSNIFGKLAVSRRTQAVEKAKRLGLIP